MRPLEQWICDSCGGVIESVREGCLEWTETEKGGALDFQLVHAAQVLAEGTHCFSHWGEPEQRTSTLRQVAGGDGLAWWISMIDVGAHHEPTRFVSRVRDLGSFAEVMRRLFLPGYEEARTYWALGVEEGQMEGVNEVHAYSRAFLEEVIARWRDAPEGRAIWATMHRPTHGRYTLLPG